ncbi:MAG: dipeptidase [Candidatus Aminicenantales bacterium]
MRESVSGKKRTGKGILCLFLVLASGFFLIFPWKGPEESLDYYFSEAGCTSIMAGRLATTDGSVITAHSCDGNYRTWLNIVPRRKHFRGAKDKVYFGKLHTETAWDLRGLDLKGEIPQVQETSAFLNTAYPCMNEHQLAIGETTIRGRPELYNRRGMLVIEELERLMLERCTNARDAIRLAGDLVKKYGYGDRGECLTIADPREVWHFEIFGPGLGKIGAVWAAVRIPDDHVGISANRPRIGEIDLEDPDHYIASENVFSLSVEKGWWDPENGEPFKFWKAYDGRKPFGVREYFVLKSLAPSLPLDMDAEELPFSVRPEKKLSVKDIMGLYRETYAGTEFDMTKNLMVKDRRSGKMIKSPVAHPWMSYEMRTLLNTLKPGVVERYRTIAIAACAYSHIIQCRSWLPDPVGGICWFAFDNPAQSPRIPIFAGVTELPPSFEIGAQHRFRTDSACWAFRRANRLATVRWGEAGRFIQEAVREFEEKAFADLADIEKRALELWKQTKKGEEPQRLKKYLTKYTNDFARAAMQKWWELGNRFWAMFARGF